MAVGMLSALQDEGTPCNKGLFSKCSGAPAGEHYPTSYFQPGTFDARDSENGSCLYRPYEQLGKRT